MTAAFWLELAWWATFVGAALAARRAWRKLPDEEVRRLHGD